MVWVWLFVLSTFSYLVDYFHVQGLLRWSLILLFMLLKAGLIVAVFMHMAWERLALIYAILLPPALVAGVRRHHDLRVELHAADARALLRRRLVSISAARPVTSFRGSPQARARNDGAESAPQRGGGLPPSAGSTVRR